MKKVMCLECDKPLSKKENREDRWVHTKCYEILMRIITTEQNKLGLTKSK